MEKVNFGVTKRGEEASLYVLENKNNTTIKVTDYGATLVSLLFADKAGVQKDLVLGYDNVTGYEEHTSYFGAIIGRNGNRIKDSRFTINGKEYRIDENENHNNLHSGKNGFNTVIWEVREHTDNSITFYHYSSETEQKFPGNMEITVTYTIADDDTLHIVYNGKADADTVMNCTNHSYFNLNGHESGSIEGQVLQIFADAYTPVVDSSAIPTGEIASVEGTPMDFRTEKQIGQDIRADFEQLLLPEVTITTMCSEDREREKSWQMLTARKAELPWKLQRTAVVYSFMQETLSESRPEKVVQPITTEVHFVWSPSFIQMR